MDSDFYESLAELRADVLRQQDADHTSIGESLLTLIELLQEREQRAGNNSGSAARETP